MNLAVDIGNTLVKYAVFEGDIIKCIKKSSDVDQDIILDITNLYDIRACIVSSVRKEIPTLEIENINPIYLSYKTKIPCKTSYTSMSTLGVDRIANIVAAVSLFKDRNVLIIDAGSCVTIDLVNSKGIHLGGRISPGIEMRYRSLSDFTGNLPKLKLQSKSNYIGNDTNSSIISGVQKGLVSELEKIIVDLKKENHDLCVIITGGDTFFFEKELKNTIFADQNLVLKGLNEILKYNE